MSVKMRGELDLRAVEQGLWSRFSEKLVGGLKGELSQGTPGSDRGRMS